MTFHKDGTFHTTPSSNLFTAGEGIWEKDGPLTFAETNRGYILDSAGQLALIVDTTETIEVSGDGRTYVSAGVSKVRLPDETLVNTVSFTGIATRLAFE